MYELTTIVDFEAAHQLRNYPGKCARLHGHNWQVEVTVAGNKLDEMGMLIDFKVLKQKVNQVIEGLDHYYLNELEAFRENNPSAENISQYIYQTLKNKFIPNIKLCQVKVWESPRSAVTYRED
ncbi:MAG: queuosine biosynthesis protein QueD [Firmicutes bacterium]|nr:queuosine biosynthesis protein QueD [Bacillota bacterium]